MNFEKWSREPVWKDASKCVGNLTKSFTGTLDNPRISEAGTQLSRRTPRAVVRRAASGPVRRRALSNAEVQQRGRGQTPPREPGGLGVGVRRRREEIARQTCPSVEADFDSASCDQADPSWSSHWPGRARVTDIGRRIDRPSGINASGPRIAGPTPPRPSRCCPESEPAHAGVQRQRSRR